MTRDRFPVVIHVLMLRERPTTEVFLLRRAGTGVMDGRFVPPGGHWQRGEGLEEAAARECREETGITPGTLVPLCLVPYEAGGEQGLNVIFEGRRLPGDPGLAEPESSDLAGWFALTSLPDSVAAWVRDVLDLRSRGEWYREHAGN